MVKPRILSSLMKAMWTFQCICSCWNEATQCRHEARQHCRAPCKHTSTAAHCHLMRRKAENQSWWLLNITKGKLRPESRQLTAISITTKKVEQPIEVLSLSYSVGHNMSLDTGRLLSSLAVTLSLPLTHLACSNRIPLYLFYIYHAEHCRYTHQATQSHAVLL